MTLMFCAFEGNALILRVYGTARTITPRSPEWVELYALFSPNAGARQLFELNVDLVQTSCGQAVPFFDYKNERDELNEWAANKGDAGIKQYQLDRNGVSLDGKAIA